MISKLDCFHCNAGIPMVWGRQRCSIKLGIVKSAIAGTSELRINVLSVLGTVRVTLIGHSGLVQSQADRNMNVEWTSSLLWQLISSKADNTKLSSFCQSCLAITAHKHEQVEQIS